MKASAKTDSEKKIIKKLYKGKMAYIMTISFAVVICTLLIARQLLVNTDNNNVGANDSNISLNAMNIEKEDISSEEDLIHINNIKDVMNSKIKLPEGSYSKEVSYSQYADEVGLNKTIELPQDMIMSKDTTKVYYNSDGSMFSMSGFIYSSSNEDENKYLQLRFAKGKIPLTDVRYTIDSQLESSLDGTKVIIYYNKDFDTFISDFLVNGIGYSLEAVGISQEDFIKIIKSIVI